MKLTKDEREVLEGKKGRAKQKAMELLVQYGEALGAERFINTNNVHLLIAFFPYPNTIPPEEGDELVSKFLLDSDEEIIVDYVEVFNTAHIWPADLEQWQKMGVMTNEYN
jgi:predicted aconitase